jgi:hypothetical protein
VDWRRANCDADGRAESVIVPSGSSPNVSLQGLNPAAAMTTQTKNAQHCWASCFLAGEDPVTFFVSSISPTCRAFHFPCHPIPLSGDTESEMSAVDFARVFHFLCQASPQEMTAFLTDPVRRDTKSEMLLRLLH